MIPTGPGLLLPAALLAQLADAVTVIGPDWRYRYASPSVAEIAGRPVAELVGAEVWEVFPEAVGTAQHAAVLRAMEQRTTVVVTWYFDRVQRWYEQRCVPAGDGLLLLVDDVTEQERTAHRAERLVEVGEALAAATTPGEVNRVVVAQVLPEVDAVGSLLIADDEKGVVRALGQGPRLPDQDWVEYPLARRTPGTAAYATGRPVFLSSLKDVALDYPEAAEGLRAGGHRSVAALPLAADGRLLGALVTAFRQERALPASDRQFLTTAAAMAAQALVRAGLLDVERRSVRALQRSLLPQALPAVDGLLTAVRYVASDRAALVGGDWYDVVPLAGGAVALVLGDVEGHDLEAAALMGLVRSAVRAYALEGHPPAVVLERANTFLAGLALGRIVTLTFAQLHPRELLITTVSAGHPPTLVVGPQGEVTEVPSEIGPPLGVQDEGLHWLETTSTLPEHGVFAMFSDGLVEVRGEDLDVGLQRVRDAIAATRHEGPAEVAEALLACRGESHDDVALLVARLTATAGAGRRVARRLPARPASVFLARRYARQLLQAWELPPGVVERAELVVSELVTNAARHSEEDLELTLAVAPRVLRVEVADTSHRVPDAVVKAPTDDATSGRGLLLVDSVASRWGVESEGLSKLVWAELDL